MCEKHQANGKGVFWAYMGLECIWMWLMQRVYLEGKLMKAVQSFYVHIYSRACVRVGMDVSEYFPVNVGLGQGCLMSPWLLNVDMYGWCCARGECEGTWETAATAECK